MKLETNGTLEYAYSPLIAVPHGFTCRLGGVSQEHLGRLNLSMHRGDLTEHVAENHRILAAALGYDTKNLVFTHQVHSDIVRPVGKADALGLDHHTYPESDGIITNEDGVALCIFTADCTPILLHDPMTGAVGAVHAGWRSTAADIAGKAVAAMASSYGCDPATIRAAIGPNIGFCHFQTDEEVPLAMVAAFGQAAEAHIRRDGEKYYVNLKAINALALSRAGVTQIDISTDCTLCQPDRYFSHRATGGQRGSQGAVILCRREHL